MPLQPSTLPFTVPDLFGGFAEGEGLARISSPELILEFVVRDNVLHILKSGVKEIRIPQSEIDFVRLQKGWFRTRLHLRLKSMKWLENLPSRDNAELVLRIARRDRERATDFVQVLSQG